MTRKKGRKGREGKRGEKRGGGGMERERTKGRKEENSFKDCEIYWDR